jgi:hypothetical protein
LPDFSWYNIPKQGKNTNREQNIPNWLSIYIQNEATIFQMATKHYPFQGPSKNTQIGIFGLKIYHLAALVSALSLMKPDISCNRIE